MNSPSEYIKNCYKSQKYCDLELVATADNKRILAHRAILFSASSYFKLLFESPLQEKDQFVYKIPEMSGDILQQVVDYCYLDEINITEENVDAVMMAASYLQMRGLEKKCIESYKAIMRMSNCLGIWNISEQYVFDDLKIATIAFACYYFKEVVESLEFMYLSKSQMEDILKRDDLRMDSEEDAFNALVKWVRFDLEERKGCFKALLEHIRFRHVKKSILLGSIYATSRALGLDEVLLNSMFESSETNQIGQRSPVPVELYSLRRNWPEWSISIYNIKSDDWKQNATFAKIAHEHEYEVVSVRDQLIIVEARPNAPRMRSIDIHTGEEKILNPMPIERTNMSIVHFKNAILIIGGSSEGAVLRSVGKYDLDTDKWTEIMPMSTARETHESVVIANKIFVMGGCSEIVKQSNQRTNDKALKTAEYYDSELDKWFPAPPMLTPRAKFDAGVANGFVYVVGGTAHYWQEHTIERFSMKNFTWTKLKITVCWDHPRSAVFIQNWIFINKNKKTRFTQGQDCFSFEKKNLENGEVVPLKCLETTIRINLCAKD